MSVDVSLAEEFAAKTLTEPTAGLIASAIDVGYGQKLILEKLDVDIPAGGFTVIVGPNGCGKSTLLRTLGRILTPRSGAVSLDGTNVTAFKGREFARKVALLAQSPTTPGAITVADLVARGRFPYQSLLRQWSIDDAKVVEESLQLVGMAEHADIQVEELSGGQRQRVWIAMALAQKTDILLLDEPTTFLDLSHQIEVLDLCSTLHNGGRTLVAVLHDLNLAARYATHVIVMKDGEIHATGTPSQVLTEKVLQEVFGLRARIIPDPETGQPLVIPAATNKTQHQ